jgi:hypothetical protein
MNYKFFTHPECGFFPYHDLNQTRGTSAATGLVPLSHRIQVTSLDRPGLHSALRIPRLVAPGSIFSPAPCNPKSAIKTSIEILAILILLRYARTIGSISEPLYHCVDLPLKESSIVRLFRERKGGQIIHACDQEEIGTKEAGKKSACKEGEKETARDKQRRPEGQGKGEEMKLKDARENYYEFSRKTSEIVRQLGFAGIALIWIFRAEGGGQQIIPGELVPAAALIVTGLAFDLLHAVVGTLAWGIYHRYKETTGTKEQAEFLAPAWINWGTIFFFWAKTIVMAIAYLYLLRFLIDKFL